MRLISEIRYRVRALLRSRAMDEELEAELQDHLARETAARIERGVAPAKAQREAVIILGGTTRFAEATRDTRGWRWLSDLRVDLRHAWRLIRRYPAFSLSSILIAGLGIGATTMVYSAVYGVLLRPFPFPNAERITSVKLTAGQGAYPTINFDNFQTIAGQRDLISAAGMYTSGRLIFVEHGVPQYLNVEYFTPSLFALLGVAPAIGRAFVVEDADADPGVALLSHEFWLTRFGGDSAVVGRSVDLEGGRVQVLGVMPPEFRGPRLQDAALWLPARYQAAGLISGSRRLRGGTAFLALRPGITPDEAVVQLNRSVRIRAADAISGDTLDATISLNTLQTLVVLDGEQPLWILFGAVCLVLCLAASNVATLAMARSSVRAHEMSVRAALGAGKGRRVRQAITETLVLMLIACGVGVGIGYIGLTVFIEAGVDVLPRLQDIHLDAPVLLFSLGVTLLLALAVALVPLLARRDGQLTGALAASQSRGGARHGDNARSILVVAEVALSVVLLVGAGLLLKGFLRVMPTSPGFALDHRISLTFNFGRQPGADAPEQVDQVRRITEGMRGLTGVRDVAVSSNLPLVRLAAIVPVTPEEHATGEKLRGNHVAISANYFTVMDIPMVDGRVFTEADNRGTAMVAIVNASAASRWWPGGSPIGKELRYDFPGRDPVVARVVGVAADTRSDGQRTGTGPEFFVPFEQSPVDRVNFLVHTSGNPALLADALKREIWRVSPLTPVGEVMTLEEIAGDSVRMARFYTALTMLFAVLAIIIAAAGLFSALAYAVSRRSREIGIRLAVGAPHNQVAWLILRQGLTITMVGLAGGIAVALATTRYLESVLLEVTPTDTGVFVIAAVVLLVIATAACLIPARRVLRIDPVRSLKEY